MIKILSARIARYKVDCLLSVRGQARKIRIDKFELDEGFQPYTKYNIIYYIID